MKPELIPNDNEADLIAANDNSPQTPSLAFDPSLFEGDLTDCDMTAEQRLEVLQIIWNVCTTCADISWGITPTQSICGKLLKTAFGEAIDSENTLESGETSENKGDK